MKSFYSMLLVMGIIWKSGFAANMPIDFASTMSTYSGPHYIALVDGKCFRGNNLDATLIKCNIPNKNPSTDPYVFLISDSKIKKIESDNIIFWAITRNGGIAYTLNGGVSWKEEEVSAYLPVKEPGKETIEQVISLDNDISFGSEIFVARTNEHNLYYNAGIVSSAPEKWRIVKSVFTQGNIISIAAIPHIYDTQKFMDNINVLIREVNNNDYNHILEVKLTEGLKVELSRIGYYPLGHPNDNKDNDGFILPYYGVMDYAKAEEYAGYILVNNLKSSSFISFKANGELNPERRINDLPLGSKVVSIASFSPGTGHSVYALVLNSSNQNELYVLNNINTSSPTWQKVWSDPDTTKSKQYIRIYTGYSGIRENYLNTCVLFADDGSYLVFKFDENGHVSHGQSKSLPL